MSSTALSGLGFSSRVLGLHLISPWKVLPLISPSATSMQSAAVAPLGEPSAQDRGDVTFVLRNQLPQIFHLGESEGNGLLSSASFTWCLLRSSAARLMVTLRNPAPPWSSGAGDRDRVAPIARQQRGQVGDLVIGHPGQHILGNDVVEPASSNQCQHDRGARAATVRTREQP